jgi:hypothetical protein
MFMRSSQATGSTVTSSLVKYNPYKDQTFVRIDGNQKVPVRQARDVIMTCHDNSSPTVVAAGCTEL